MFELGGIFGSILSGILSDYLYRVSILESQKDPSTYKEVNSTQIRMSLVRYFMISKHFKKLGMAFFTRKLPFFTF